jgi:regulator of sigma D
MELGKFCEEVFSLGEKYFEIFEMIISEQNALGVEKIEFNPSFAVAKLGLTR